MLNNVIIMGRLTRDPELRRTQTGTSVASLTLACDRVACWEQFQSRPERGFATLAETRSDARAAGWKVRRSTPSGTVTVLVAPMRSNSSRANSVVHTTVS